MDKIINRYIERKRETRTKSPGGRTSRSITSGMRHRQPGERVRGPRMVYRKVFGILVSRTNID